MGTPASRAPQGRVVAPWTSGGRPQAMPVPWMIGNNPEDPMKNSLAVLAVLAFAVLLVVGAPLMAGVTDDPAATGKVTAFEAGKSLSVQVGNDSKSYKIDAETKIEGELAVGKEVQVWVKEGVATKIVVKKD